MIATGGTVGLAEGIIDDTHVLCFHMFSPSLKRLTEASQFQQFSISWKIYGSFAFAFVP